MDSLNVLRVVVSPCASHPAGVDVVGHDVAVIGQPLLAESAETILRGDLPVEELPHFAVRAEFPVSPGMLRILDPVNAHPALGTFLLGFALFRSRSGSGGSGRVDSGGVASKAS